MIKKTVLHNAQIVTPQKIIKGNLLIENGKIKEVITPSIKRTTSPNLSLQRRGTDFDQEIDCTNLTILPGLIDTHVHFRDPGLTQKEDFQTGTQAAAAGGVTTVFDMPNTVPPTISEEAFKNKLKIAEQKSVVNYNLYAGLTNDNFDEINKIKNLAGIKIFFGSSTGNLLVNDLNYLEKVFQETNHLLAFHAEDENIIQKNTEKFKKSHEPEIHSKIRDRQAEINAIESVLQLAQKHPKTRVHLCHISTKEAVELIKKYDLPNVTAEVSMHHLLLNENDYAKHGNFVKINPPLRTTEDNVALLEALKNNTIQTIATDHAPHLKSEKEQDYWQAPSGMPMVELTLPLLLNLYNQNKISLQEITKWTSFNPAKIWNLSDKGEIKVDNSADLTIVDLNQKHIVKNDKLFTKCKWTPFHNKEIQGKVLYTFVGGKMVFGKGEIKKVSS